MNYRCDGQVVDFIYIPYEIIHSTIFREDYLLVKSMVILMMMDK